VSQYEMLPLSVAPEGMRLGEEEPPCTPSAYRSLPGPRASTIRTPPDAPWLAEPRRELRLSAVRWVPDARLRHPARMSGGIARAGLRPGPSGPQRMAPRLAARSLMRPLGIVLHIIEDFACYAIGHVSPKVALFRTIISCVFRRLRASQRSLKLPHFR
jgi:hypothetical protein